MSADSESVDVLIVGGGPTGLATANALGMRGIKCLLIEAEPGVATLPRAVSIDDEAMRFMQSLSLADQLRNIVIPGTGTKYFGADGQLLVYGRGPERQRHGYPIKNPLDHPEFQHMLSSGLSRFPSVEVMYETSLVSFRQTSEVVLATIEVNGLDQTIACQYLVGADGGRSLVRRLIGEEPMVGTSFGERWLVLDTVNDPHDERYAMHYGDPARPRVVVVGPDGRCRYEFLLRDDEDPNEDEVLRLGLRLVSPYRDVDPEDVVRCTVYKFYALVARRFNSGRVFIAGDAAHMMPPFAAQGLNSGLRDAANLSWKLADVLLAKADPQLLDTYTTERRPHVDAVVRLSVSMGAVLMTESRVRARVRDLLLRSGQWLPRVNRFSRELRSRSPVHYHQGFVFPDADSNGTVGSMLVQPRVFEAGGGYVRLDDILGTGYALLAVGGAIEHAEELTHQLWQRLSVTRTHVAINDRLPARGVSWRGVCDLDGQLAEQLSRCEGRVLLIRPDRVIAGTFHPSAEWQFASRVEAGLGPPVTSPITVQI